MATANKLSYLLDTKNKIRDSINQDFNNISDDTPFREYTNALNENIDKLKEFIPTSVTSGKEIIVEDAIPLKPKELKFYGESRQESTRGINLFDYTKITASNNGLTNILNDDGSITSTGQITSNYANVIAKTDITDILENNQNYVLFQSNPSTRVYIQLRKKNLSGTWEYLYNFSQERISFNVDKASYTNYEISVQTGTTSSWGDVQRTITQKYMLYKDLGEESEWEPYTGGASPNPDYPQEINNLNTIEYENEGISKIELNISLGNEPLRSIDEVKDELIVDLKNGDILKKKYISEIVLNGSESWTTASSIGGVRFVCQDYVDNTIVPTTKKGYLKSNMFITLTADETNNAKNGIASATSGKFVIFYDKFKNKTAAEFKQWLSQNNIIIDYAIKAPGEIKIGQLTQDELESLKLFAGYNKITGPYMDLTYFIDWTKYQGNIEEISLSESNEIVASNEEN